MKQRNTSGKRMLLAFAAGLLSMTQAQAQSEIYPQHFDLGEVTLLDGPFKTAMDTNINLLLQYDVDRLLTPFIRQSGLSKVTTSKYYHTRPGLLGRARQHPEGSIETATRLYDRGAERLPAGLR